MERDIQPRPLNIVFMGYNTPLTDYFIRQFASDNAEQVTLFNKAQQFIVLADGTRIKGYSPSTVLHGFDGHRFDQLILADDERELIYIEAAREIEIVRASLALSCVPEEYQVLYYNVFAPEPCRDFRARGLVHLPGTTTRETARVDLSPEMEIVLIRLNPSLSRFQKWRLGRKIKKEKAHEYTL